MRFTVAYCAILFSSAFGRNNADDQLEVIREDIEDLEYPMNWQQLFKQFEDPFPVPSQKLRLHSERVSKQLKDPIKQIKKIIK